MAQMSALFLLASIVVGFIAWMGEEEFTTTFVNGARDLLGVALVIGVARGIVFIMDAGKITDTILFWSANAVNGLSTVMFINAMFGLQLLLSFFVPSSSGLAVLDDAESWRRSRTSRTSAATWSSRPISRPMDCSISSIRRLPS
jgi:uncharacterized ion transporter superfamily protein YfcC